MDRRADENDDFFWVTRGRRRNSWKHPTTVQFMSNINKYRSRDESDNKIKERY